MTMVLANNETTANRDFIVFFSGLVGLPHFFRWGSSSLAGSQPHPAEMEGKQL